MVVATLHHGCHPAECEDREDVGVFVGAFIVVTQRVVVAQALLHQPFQRKLNRGQANANSEYCKVCDMFLVQLLRDERAKLYTICDEEKKPVEEDDTVGIARAPVLNVLDVEDDEERNDGDGGGPKAEVPGPDAGKVLDLECGLNGSRGDEGSEGTLFGAYRQRQLTDSDLGGFLPIWRRSASSA